jgi:hypothetical protein
MNNSINNKYICPLCRSENINYKILTNKIVHDNTDIDTDIDTDIENNTKNDNILENNTENKIYNCDLCIICQHNISNILFTNCLHNCICDNCITIYINKNNINNHTHNSTISTHNTIDTIDTIYTLFLNNCLLYLFIFIPCSGIIILLLMTKF